MTIRDVPEEIHAWLKKRAKRNRRSLNQQVIADWSQMGYQEADGERPASVEREILESQQLRARARAFLTAEEIDAAKREGLA